MFSIHPFFFLHSKMRWMRRPEDDHLRFLAQSELYLFLNFGRVIDYVRQLLRSGNNLYLWLAVLLEFQQITDPEDKAERWSSYRHGTYGRGNTPHYP